MLIEGRNVGSVLQSNGRVYGSWPDRAIPCDRGYDYDSLLNGVILVIKSDSK